MSNASQVTEAQLRSDSINSIANVSSLLRQAIAAALPVSPDQYLTIAVPGTVVNVNPISAGGTFIYDASTSAFPPTVVRQAEAKLVDGMMPLSYVMIGNTGKSVSRSYSRALDGLVPRKATVKSGANQIRSPGEKSYDQAMEYLTNKDPTTGLTPVDLYMQKQRLWAQAKLDAKNDAKSQFPGDVVAIRQAYDDWNQANFRKYKFAVQGQWMDWVANGHKYDVEYNFGLVDTESIMGRIEDSKQSMRNASLVDADGANELQGVTLTPKNWATLCKLKSDGWWAKNGKYTLDQLDAEIARLDRLSVSYKVMSDAILSNSYPLKGAKQPTADEETTETALQTAYKALYAADADLQEAIIEYGPVKTQEDRAKRSVDANYKAKHDAVVTAQGDLQTALKESNDNKIAWSKYKLANLDDAGKATMKQWLDTTQKTIQDQITELEAKRSFMVSQAPVSASAIVSAKVETVDDAPVGETDLAPVGSELADPIFGIAAPSNPAVDSETAPPDATVSDPWTTITCSYSATEQSSTTLTSSWGMSAGVSVGWGLWSAGGGYSHDQSSSDSVSDMANCDVNISFSSLVVNVDRPWLYGELFTDFELDVADNVLLSPGPQKLQTWMKGQGNNPGYVNNLASYNAFPAYPTALIIAADTVIEFHGDTQHVENHFSSVSNSGSFNVGYGPWSVQSSFHQASSKQAFSMSTTATGCRLSFGSPQVIGYVSQILPPLPREPGFEPMIQGPVKA